MIIAAKAAARRERSMPSSYNQAMPESARTIGKAPRRDRERRRRNRNGPSYGTEEHDSRRPNQVRASATVLLAHGLGPIGERNQPGARSRRSKFVSLLVPLAVISMHRLARWLTMDFIECLSRDSSISSDFPPQNSECWRASHGI